MVDPEAQKMSRVLLMNARRRTVGFTLLGVLTCTLVCLLVLTVTAPVLGNAQDDEGYQRINPRGFNEIDRINEALHRWGRTFLMIAGALFAIAVLKIVAPAQIYHNLNDRRLVKAVARVDDLIKRIQAEAEATTSDSKETSSEAGILTGMAEIAEFDQAEQVPAYVLTVNDLMFDNIRLTLHKLRGFKESSADRYRNYMFSVLKGIKTITEESLQSGAPSSLAVDVKDYFRDDSRYRAWEKLLRRASRKGDHRELADTFLLFMRDIRQGRPLVVPEKGTASTQLTAVTSVAQAPEIPHVLNEETLPVLQQAAIKEAGNLVSLVRTGKPSDPAYAWQFELVQRQQQLHLRDESQKMLKVFLNCERKELPHVVRTRMLPCRTWPHVLYMLGVKNAPTLEKRVEDGWLTIQEVHVLLKAFLQTFAKKESIAYVYGNGADAELMMNLHVPQVRSEALKVLRRLAQCERPRFDRAVQSLNEEETPQHSEVVKLVQHYVHQRHDPPGMSSEP
jgi:hypothetical protein